MLRSTTPNSDELGYSSQGNETEVLREQLSALGAEVSRIAEERMSAAKLSAEHGVTYARDVVEEYPLTSLALAFSAGAVIGLALVPSRRVSMDWRHASVNSVRDDLGDYTERLRRSIRSTAMGNGIVSNLERVADTVSSVDAKATIGPVWDRLVSWLEMAKDRASTAASDLKKGN